MTCQRLTDYAKRMDRPFLVIHAAPKADVWTDGSVEFLTLKRSPLAIKLDQELAYDPLFQRHTNRVLRKLLEFQPDVIHITGMNDVGIVGAYLAWKLQLPLLGSWHTNVHEFAAQRLRRMFRFLPEKAVSGISDFAEKHILRGTVLYYKMPKVVLAPNQELIDLIGDRTHRAARLMARGVDTERYSPAKRTVTDGKFRLGFVGRLRAEKNVRMLPELEKALLAEGRENFEFLIVGEGNEREYLEKNLKNAEFTGFIAGDELAAAYANMDVFVFPSKTDAYGNVVQEAGASGVPSIVTDKGGPKYLVDDGKTGFIAKDTNDFLEYIRKLMDEPETLRQMREAAREKAMTNSWDSVFAGVFEGYEEALEVAARQKQAAASNGSEAKATGS